jgi:hypothetical protein
MRCWIRSSTSIGGVVGCSIDVESALSAGDAVSAGRRDPAAACRECEDAAAMGLTATITVRPDQVAVVDDAPRLLTLDQLRPSLAAADLDLDDVLRAWITALTPTPPLATDRTEEQH